MKRNKVMSLLNISTSTVDKWLRKGKLKATRLPSGHWNYDDETVYQLAGYMDHRQTIIYSRVSTGKQKNELKQQIMQLELFCAGKGWVIDNALSEIASGVEVEEQKALFQLLNDVQRNKVKRVVITEPHRLSRTHFTFIEAVFNYHGTEIVVISDIENEATDNEEIFEETLSLLRAFKSPLYNKRRLGFKSVLKKTGANTKMDSIKQRRTKR